MNTQTSLNSAVGLISVPRCKAAVFIHLYSPVSPEGALLGLVSPGTGEPWCVIPNQAS